MGPTRPCPLTGSLALVLLLSLLTPLRCRAQAAATAPATPPALEIVSGTWKVGQQPEVDVTAILVGMVKDGFFELRVSAANMGITPPRQGLVGNLTVTYRLNGGELQTKTVRGGGTLLRLGKPSDATNAPEPEINVPHRPMDAAAVLQMPLVQLTAQEPREATNSSPVGSLLVRELQRQAVWLAATEELGLRTRDMALGEPLANDAPGKTATVLISTQFWRSFGIDTILASPGGGGGSDASRYTELDLTKYVAASPDKLLVKMHNPLWTPPWIDYALIVKDTELQSRHELVSALQKAGVLGTNQADPAGWAHDPVEVSSATLAQLQQMNPVAQFAAIRSLHAQIRQNGDSPEIMEALVRGYANLAFMTSPTYSGAYKTYMARALLYAQRLVVHTGSSAQSLDVRGYAWAMAGFDALALNDLAAARNKQRTNVPTPPWVDVIEAWCHYDLTKMQAAADAGGPYQPLAQMLTLAIAIDGYPSAKVLRTGQACLTRQPDNLWAMQQLFRSGQLGLTATMPGVMLDAIPGILHDTAPVLKLPAEADRLREGLRGAGGTGGAGSAQYGAVADFAAALAKSSQAGEDAGEPSLEALAGLVRDEEFTAAFMEAIYLRNHLGAGPQAVADYVEQSTPAWREHTLAGLMQFAAADPAGDHTAFRAAADKVKPVDAGAWLKAAFMDDLPYGDLKDKWSLWLIAAGHADPITMDFPSPAALEGERLDLNDFIGFMREVSPHAALPVCAWMDVYPTMTRLNEQAKTAATIAQMREDFSDRPQVLQRLSGWAAAMHDYKTSIDLLTQLQRDDPSIEVADTLATQYVAIGDLERAKGVVDAAGSLPDAGLGGAALAYRLAAALMRRGMAKDALPYATTAADTYAGWGLQTLADCADSLGDPDKVEALLKATAERYPGGELQWYAWAKRAKRPEEAEAKKALQAYIAGHPETFEYQADALLVEGQAGKALDVLKAHREEVASITQCLNYAVVAAEAGEAAEVDYALQKGAKLKDYGNLIAAMEAISAGTDDPKSLMLCELDSGPALDSPYPTATWLGRFLAAYKRKPEAVRYLTLALMQNGSSSEANSLVRIALEKLGEDPVALLKAWYGRKEDFAALIGTWKTQQGEITGTVTFAADHTVRSAAGLYGTWWESGGRILISWTPNSWQAVPWPVNTQSTTADFNQGKDKFVMIKN